MYWVRWLRLKTSSKLQIINFVFPPKNLVLLDEKCSAPHAFMLTSQRAFPWGLTLCIFHLAKPIDVKQRIHFTIMLCLRCPFVTIHLHFVRLDIKWKSTRNVDLLQLINNTVCRALVWTFYTVSQTV